VSVFIDLYKKNHQLMAQEQRLKAINNELEERVKERTEELLNKNLELESKNRELKKINNDLDNFVYTASHDLKGPIANLEGLISILSKKIKGKIGEDELNIFNMITTSISKFNATIRDLTEITKVQKDVSEEMEHVSFSNIAEDIKRDIQKLITDSGVTFSEEYLITDILYAKRNLRSILYNLLTNGISTVPRKACSAKYQDVYRQWIYSVICSGQWFGDSALISRLNYSLCLNECIHMWKALA
jgi:light-regulated signal transduction histidine kinase (bacteriophytochrome)